IPEPSSALYGTASIQAPQDLVGNTVSNINWGMIVYPTISTSLTSSSCSTGEATFAVPVDTSDSCSSTGCINNAAIEALLAPTTAQVCIDPASGGCTGRSATGTYWSGLNAGDPGTNVGAAKAALEYTRHALTALNAGTTSVTLTKANNLTVTAGNCSAWPAA